jgi:hypothetical protein
MRVRTMIIVVASLAALILGGCTRSSSGSTQPATEMASPSAASKTMVATDTDNGRTLTLAINDQLVVQLASTYWRYAALDTGTPLSSVGPPSVAATPPGKGCVPGAGCGTVTARFVAVAAGQVTIAADRTSCGEALPCVGTAGTYRLHVLVR